MSDPMHEPDRDVCPPEFDSLAAHSLGVWDAVSIIIGIVVGTAIFKVPMLVFQNVTGPWQALGVWLLGGALSLCGAFCYAELATTYPRNGGDYEYLSRAYGGWMGFLFGWAQLTVVLSGSIGLMAYAFADYSLRLGNLPAWTATWIGAAAVLGLSLLNALGAVVGKSVQNLLSLAKVVGLLGVAVTGLALGVGATKPAAPVATPGLMGPGFGLAMVFVLLAFGGWNDAAFVAAEVRDQRRNLPRALLAGIAAVTVIYIAVNAAYLSGLGFEAARRSSTPAADLLGQAFGDWGARLISLLVMISALGAINGMILTGSRVYATLGADHRLFAWLAAGNSKSSAPIAALAVQAMIATLLILVVGTEEGRTAIDFVPTRIGLHSLPWSDFPGGFEMIAAGTAPVFWTFFLLTGLALFVLRIRDRGRVRPFSVPFFPLPPLVFCATCAYMLYSSLAYAKWLALIGAVPLVVALPLSRTNRM
jgi:APA family basic amino acid/polyamine antiporter